MSHCVNDLLSKLIQDIKGYRYREFFFKFAFSYNNVNYFGKVTTLFSSRHF